MAEGSQAAAATGAAASTDGHQPAAGAAVPIGAQVFLRPLANPLSLGFLGLFYATAALAAAEAGLVGTAQMHEIALGIVAFTVPAQLIASVYGFLVRDMVCATGMGVLAGVWATVGITTLLHPPGAISSGLALVLVLGSFALLMPAIGAAQTKVLAAAVMFTTTVRWAVTAGYEATGSGTWELAAAAAGFLLAAFALYAALAFELEDQRRKTVLPTMRRHSGAVAMLGSLAEQVDAVAHEAGVRKQV